MRITAGRSRGRGPDERAQAGREADELTAELTSSYWQAYDQRLAIRSAQSSLNTLLYAVNQCYEEGLYFSDYLAFCADAARRIPPPGSKPVPAGFDRITADAITFTYPGASRPALRDISIEIGRGEVVALVGENGTSRTAPNCPAASGSGSRPRAGSTGRRRC